MATLYKTIILSYFIILINNNNKNIAEAAVQNNNANTLIYGCHHLNDCNGHGICNYAKGICECYPSWGSTNEISKILSNQRPSPDCSKRVCPIGKSWSNRMTTTTTTNTNASQEEELIQLHDIVAECSNAGYCNRIKGTCKCYDGFRGISCAYRNLCNDNCSGHGTCTSLKNIGIISKRNYYKQQQEQSTVNNNNNILSNRYWEYDRIFGCICDSTWVVGLGNGEIQQSEWFGPDCSNRRCPSGDNPDTVMNETDCTGIIAADPSVGSGANSGVVGLNGNLCHYDCSGKGVCDYSTGTCACFEDNVGPACEVKRIR